MKMDANKETPLFVGNIFIKGLIKNTNRIIIKKKNKTNKENKYDEKDDDEKDDMYKLFRRFFRFLRTIYS